MPGPDRQAPLAEPSVLHPEVFSAPVEVLDVRFRSDDGQFAIIDVVSEDQHVVVRGPVGHLDAGDHAHVDGRWTTHPVYGEQVEAQSALPVDPDTDEARVRFLKNLPGIGDAFARQLVRRYGEELFAVLDEDPVRAFESLRGLGPRAAARIAEAWREHRSDRELHLLLAPHGLGRLVPRLIDRYDGEAAAKVRANPYLLTREHGVGFLLADRLARGLGLPADDPQRLGAALVHSLDEAGSREGHVFLPEAELLAQAARLLDGLDAPAPPPTSAHLAQLEAAGAIVVEQGRVYRAGAHRAEATIAERLVALDGAPAELPVELDDEPHDGLSPEQWQAVRAVFACGVSIFVGGPGTGKTHTTAAIAAVCERHGVELALCAPTGRAAERLAQVTGAKAQTIHRLIGLNPAGQAAFDADYPLTADVVLVDEVSMVDQALMARLLEAVGPGAHLCLVGDADQLPSVAPGRVLADAIESDQFFVTRLTRIFRQAARSSIVQAAHRINAGHVPVPSELAAAAAARAEATAAATVEPAPDAAAGRRPAAGVGAAAADGESAQDAAAATEPVGELERDFFLMREADVDALAALVRELVTTRLPRHYDVSPHEIQVLAPTRRGPVGVQQLNASLQEALNAGGEPVGAEGRERPAVHTRLRIGDKVLQTRNDYQLELMNGTLLRLDADVPAEQRVVATDEIGRSLHLGYDDLDPIQLAYAMTVHKAQGCEWPIVVLVVHRANAGRDFLTRQLLYTAVTRARRALVICGDTAILQRAVANAGGHRRHTHLAHRILAAGARG